MIKNIINNFKKNSKNSKSYIFFIIFCIIILFFILCFWQSIISSDGIFLIIFLIGVLIFSYVVYPNILDESQIVIFKNSDTDKLEIKYQQFEFEIERDKVSSSPIKSTDKNSLKVHYLLKERLNEYLRNNSKILSIPKDIILISEKESKNYIKDLKLCSDDDKTIILDQICFDPIPLIFILLFNLFAILNINTIIKCFSNGFFEGKHWILILIAVLVFLLDAIYLLGKKSRKEANNYEVYRTTLDIYDRKSSTYEDSTSYYLKLSASKNCIIDKWFQVNKELYESSDKVAIYLIYHDNFSKIEIIM